MDPATSITLGTCLLRPLRDEDAESIARYANNRNVWINLRDRFPHPYGLADAIRFLDLARSMETEVAFAIDVGGEAVGCIGFILHQDVDRVSAEIGYWLGEPFWGRGIVTEALKAVTAYAIEQHDLTRVYATAFAWNPASARVLEKAGYRLEGRLERSAIKDGKIVDQLLYGYVVKEGGKGR